QERHRLKRAVPGAGGIHPTDREAEPCNGNSMLKRSSARYVLLLYLLDMALTVSALLLARGLRLALPYGKALNPGGVAMPWPVFALALVSWSFTLTSFRVYDPQRITHLQ